MMMLPAEVDIFVKRVTEKQTIVAYIQETMENLKQCKVFFQFHTEYMRL